jgi:hypothetical protein
MDTTTVLEIIKMIENQEKDITALFEGTREPELRDVSWVFKNDYVKYGAHTALSDLYYHLQSFIEAQVNQAENNLGSSE